MTGGRIAYNVGFGPMMNAGAKRPKLKTDGLSDTPVARQTKENAQAASPKSALQHVEDGGSAGKAIGQLDLAEPDGAKLRGIFDKFEDGSVASKAAFKEAASKPGWLGPGKTNRAFAEAGRSAAAVRLPQRCFRWKHDLCEKNRPGCSARCRFGFGYASRDRVTPTWRVFMNRRRKPRVASGRRSRCPRHTGN